MRAFRTWTLKTIGLAALVIAGAAACATGNHDSDLEKIGSPGFTANGFTANGFTANGFTANGFTANGFTANGFTANGFTANGFTANGLSPLDIIKSDENARELLKYIYSCAMPADAKLVIPNVVGTTSLTLTGSLNLAPAWGAEGGSCNETCQRWVSACVLARTNAFGAHVSLSIRGNNPALTVTSAEVATYSLREGTYYGNIFATKPSADPLAPPVNAPKLYACAGPESDAAYQTLRFCSSTSDDCPIQSVAKCNESTPAIPKACSTFDTSSAVGGALSSCTAPDATDTHVYAEAITVYLKAPVAGETFAVCGNAVCEVSGGETGASCPSDCHEGTWARGVSLNGGASSYSFTGSFNPSYEIGTEERQVAVCPNDASVVLGGYSYNAINLGGAASLPQVGGGGFLARYSKTGAPLWSIRSTASTTAVATTATGNIVTAGTQTGNAIVGYNVDGSPIGIVSTNGNSYIAVAKYNSAGNVMWAAGIGNDSTIAFKASRGLAVDAAGNVLVAGTYVQPVSFAAGNFDVYVAGGGQQIVVEKLDANGTFVWAKGLGGVDTDSPIHMSVDPSGNVLVTGQVIRVVTLNIGGTNYNYTYYYERTLWKLAALDGAIVWSKSSLEMGGDNGAYGSSGTSLRFDAAAAGADGSVYLTGSFSGSANFTCAAGACSGAAIDSGVAAGPYPGKVFLTKYAADGSYLWTQLAPGDATPTEIRVENEPVLGNEIVLLGGRSRDVNFGAGRFHSNTPDLFVSAYNGANGTFLWAKAYPHYGVGTANGPQSGTGAFFAGLDVNSEGSVITSGLFNGYMFADNQIIVHANPTAFYDGDLFLNSFKLPCSTPGCDLVPPVISNTPASFTVQAIGSGAQAVWYTTPTATDNLPDGVSISCAPAAGSQFAPGNTTVTCSAYDAHGNVSTSTFVVTVANTTPPTLVGLPGDILASPQPAGSSVAVNFTSPTAIDQRDGSRPTTCVPASGSAFIGTTVVTCSAADLAGNTVSGSFKVKVPVLFVPTPTPTPVPDTTAPVVTVPANIVVTGVASGNGTTINYTAATAVDNKDGVVAATCSKASGTIFPVGVTLVTCSAHDAAGNTGSASFSVTVSYTWGGIRQPINADGSSIFKLGSTVPVKFNLTGGSSLASGVFAELYLAKVTSGVVGTEVEAVSTSGADSGNDFRYDGNGEYHYNLSTKNLSAGTWQLDINLHDGVTRTVVISLRK